jgi:hypothetical protein
MDNDAIALVKKVYQNITGRKPKYEFSGKYGDNSTFNGVDNTYNVSFMVRLIKYPDGRDVVHEDVKSLELVSSIPIPTAQLESTSSVKTKINFFEKEPKMSSIREQLECIEEGPETVKSVQKRINDVINAQKDARTLIEKKGQIIMDAAYNDRHLGSTDRTNHPVGKLSLGLQLSNSEKPFMVINGPGFQATAKGTDDFPFLVNPLQYQIKALEYVNKT